MTKLVVLCAVGVSVVGAVATQVPIMVVQYLAIAVAAGLGWFIGHKLARSNAVSAAFLKAQKAELPDELAELTTNENRSGVKALFTSIRTVAGYVWLHHRHAAIIGVLVVAGWLTLQLLPGLLLAGARGTLSIFLFTMAAVALVELMLTDRNT